MLLVLSTSLLVTQDLREKRGWKVAITSAFGTSEKDEGTVTVDNNGSNARTYSAKLDSTLYEASLLIGNRLSPSFIVYLSSSYAYYDVKSNLSSSDFC